MADIKEEIGELDDPEKFYRARKNEYLGHRNKSIEMLKRSGPDFLKNKFDVALCVYSQDTNKSLFDIFDQDTRFFSEYADKKVFADMAQFMVRTGDVEIPQMESDTYEIKFLFTTIKKVRSKVKFDRKAFLKIRMDEPLFFNAFFNLLSNNNQVTAKLGKEPEIFAPYHTNRMFKEDLKNKIVQIDLYVKHQSLMRTGSADSRAPPVTVNENLRWMDDYKNPDEFSAGMRGMQAEDLPFWFFEDVNFLGQQDPITFERDNANTIDMSYPFIFKRLVMVSPQERQPSTRWLDQLNPSNMMDTTGAVQSQDDQNWYYKGGEQRGSDSMLNTFLNR